MSQPTASLYPDAWHAAEHDREQAWLNDWMCGQVCADTLDTCPAQEPATEPARPLVTAGSR